MARAERAPSAFTVAVALGAFVLYAVIARVVFDGRPLLIDELVQVMQARTFAHGVLSRPIAPHPEFFSILHMVDTNGRVYSQFPPGGPAMLAPGVLVRAPWLIGPTCGAIAVAAFATYLWRVERRAGVVVGATLLFAIAPFMAFMAGSHMNHVPALMWLVIAMAAMARVMTSPTPRPQAAFLNGIALGAAAAIRPVDALAFALPAGVWYVARALRDRVRWTDALTAAAGIAVPVSLMMWVNLRTTGAPLRFGYEVLWGKGHALGFHAAPWGTAHTPGRGLELINLYFLQLQTYLFETPIPSLVPVIAALAIVRHLDAFDRYLLMAGALVVGLYFAYWHEGFFLGPRFMYPLVPPLVLWTARLPAIVRERWGEGRPPHRTVVYAYLIAAIVALVSSIPIRARQYANGLITMRQDFGGLAERAGARDAVVLVRESWGAQVIARLWALGVSRPQTEMLYRGVDTCVLDDGVAAAERRGLRGQAAFALLQPLLRDSARVVHSHLSPDTTEILLPGIPYLSRCIRRITEDRAGYTLLAPALLAEGSNLFARDLHARDSLLLRDQPGRPVFLVRRATAAVDAPLMFVPLSVDSLLHAWRSGDE